MPCCCALGPADNVDNHEFSQTKAATMMEGIRRKWGGVYGSVPATTPTKYHHVKCHKTFNVVSVLDLKNNVQVGER